MSDVQATALPMTAADIRSCIQRHFGSGGEQYAVLFEVRNGTAWRANRSVDAVVMSLWPSLGMELWGMEIKTSRADWRRELDNPEKASEVFDYFDRWFLVAPVNVVTRECGVPTPWGWFAPHEGRLQQLRPAAKNGNVKPVDRHFLAALLRRTVKTDDAFLQSAVNAALADQRRQHEADVEKRALARMGDLKHDAEQWAQLRDALKENPGDFVYAPQTIEALRVLIKIGVGESYGAVRNLIDEVDRAHERLSKVAAELGIKRGKR